ncbi:OLC1v1007114C2 [Oldenlandia corymbosa var. corymbosa]|nr:OLC1v1007114C2 [Oldenlandia corymbosa var. corymbosa]
MSPPPVAIPLPNMTSPQLFAEKFQHWYPPAFRPISGAAGDRHVDGQASRSEYTGYKLDTLTLAMNVNESETKPDKKPVLFDLNQPPPLF